MFTQRGTLSSPLWVVAILAIMGWPGCDSGDQSAPASKPSSGDSSAAHTDADDHGHSHEGHEVHEHPTEGPHHGVLVELGNEEYHVEIVHDDATGLVTLYVLDGHAQKEVAVDAAEAIINLKHGDTPEQFKLPAQPVDGAPAGQTTRFSVTSQELAEHLHDAAAGARLSLTIGGTPFSGSIPHEDHADHAHADHDAGHDHTESK